MSKVKKIRTSDDLRQLCEQLTRSADRAKKRLLELAEMEDALAFLACLKFDQVGCDPLDPDRDLNLIEQLNQTFTYLASFRATEYLIQNFPDKVFRLNLGTKSGSDIESINGTIACEVFAAVNTTNNKKLDKDIKKVENAEAQRKYVFYLVPSQAPREYTDGNVKIVSLGF